MLQVDDDDDYDDNNNKQHFFFTSYYVPGAVIHRQMYSHFIFTTTL